VNVSTILERPVDWLMRLFETKVIDRTSLSAVKTAVSWRTAANAQLVEIESWAVVDAWLPLDEFVQGAGNLLGPALKGDLNWFFEVLGSDAMAVKGCPDRDVILDMLCRKQHDYGHQNILRTGIPGIVTRLSDKQARLENLAARGATPANESLEDALADIVGYCVIGLMLQAGTFEALL
jgi:hypothetical protein